MSDPGREPAGGRVVLLLVLALALLAGGGYAAAYAGAGGKVPHGTTVAGVGIGGLTRDRAIATLEDGLSVRAGGHYEVRAGGHSRGFRARQAGLGVDYAASVDAAGVARSWEPSRLWDYYTDGSELPAVLEVDEPTMEQFLDALDADLGTPARDGAVAFHGTRIRVTEPRRGQEIDREAARAAVEDAYLGRGDRAVAEVPLVPVEPDVDEGDVRRAIDEFANPALAGPVTLRFGGPAVRLLPRDYAGLLRLAPRDGELVPAVDRRALSRLVRSRLDLGRDPVDAAVRIEDGKPRLVRARPGVRYRPAALGEAFLGVVARGEGHRSRPVPSRVLRPDLTTREAQGLGITEQVSSVTTRYAHAHDLDSALGRASDVVDGSLLAPGETFAADGAVAPQIADAVPPLARALSRAMSAAGLERLADLTFRNDSSHGVLVTAHVTPSTPTSRGQVTVDLWSAGHGG